MKGSLSSDASNMTRLAFWKHLPAGVSSPHQVISIVVMLAIILFLAFMSHRWLASSDSPLIRYIVNGESFVLSAEDSAAMSRDLSERLEVLEHDAEQRLKRWMEEALIMTREQYQEAGEHYLDWYFSAAGSYTRLGVSLTGDMEPWMEGQIKDRLVGPSGAEQALSNLHAEYRERLLDEQQRLLSEALDDIYLHYSQVSVPAAEVEGEAIVTLNLDRMVAAANEIKGSEALPWSAPPLGVGLLGGAGITAALMARPVMVAARSMVQRFAVRLGLAATRSVTAGSTAAVGAAATGPGAVVAGTVTAGAIIAITAGTEYLALVRQEEELRPAMEEVLVETWTDLELGLRSAVEADRQPGLFTRQA
ncbi:hypothetical protein QC823_14530 [Halomonas vilamensis]|uniref:Uncharacterized protein n=1 Tax=Vreelandella vilamensis TaxID=531309 RepID=A0ABU1H7U3_9GAMM|nr:hypothetical protein [Halomonas vilamensis]MDR5900190.1 hypothetical protein [Halomonas vilamensis]